MTRFELHNGVHSPDKIEYFSFILTMYINEIFAVHQVYRSKPTHNYKPMNFIDIDENSYAFKHCGKAMTRT